MAIPHDSTPGPNFTGNDDGLPVHTFITEVENVIRKRQLTTDTNKINILRERVAGSLVLLVQVVSQTYEYFKM